MRFPATRPFGNHPLRQVLLALPVLAVLLLLAGGMVQQAYADSMLSSTVTLDRIYGEGMVLQRGREIRISGRADPGKLIEGSFNNQSATALADESGRFTLRFAPHEAGGSFTLNVRGKDKEIILGDILVGEVWLGSGQSNMEWRVKNSMNFEQEKAAAGNPHIRYYAVPRQASPGRIPDDIRANSGWRQTTPETVGDFSAVLYFFARQLQQELGVPVGIIGSSWGGTTIESWIGAEAYAAAGEAHLAQAARRQPLSGSAEEQQRQEQAAFREWEESLAADYAAQIAAASHWMEPALDSTSWQHCDLPVSFETLGMGGNGAGWFRKTVTIPEHWAGRDLWLSLGRIDDCDTTWLNGKPIGQTGSDVPDYWNISRRYRIAGDNVQAGENVIAVRVMDYALAGGFRGRADELFLQPVDSEEQIPIDKDWLFKSEFLIDWQLSKPRPVPIFTASTAHQSPAALYNGMIANLHRYPVRGVLWYQGESNTGDPRGYAKRFPLLIESWRQEWGDPNLTFIFAQLASFYRQSPGEPLPEGFFDNMEPSDSNWARLRESQVAALRLPGVGMAVCIDVGDPVDIHPANKQAVGLRMALEAQRLAYGQDVVSAAPLYRGMRIEGNAIRIYFDNTGSGLVARGGALKQFAIAGDDGVFHRAEAVIDSTRRTVLVHAPAVPAPKSVRYAWAGYPAGCNLYNEEGIPASPFRTDTY